MQTCAAPDTVQLIEHVPDRLAIRAEMACDGMVVLSDTFYPGWRARVDHRPAEIYEVNGAMRGVAVPRGTHTITMRYRPVSVYLGAALTLPASSARWVGRPSPYQRLGGRSDSMLRNNDRTTNVAKICTTHIISALHYVTREGGKGSQSRCDDPPATS